MRDVTVKAKAKMGKLPTDSFYNELIHEGNLDIKIDMLKSKYNFLAEATSKKKYRICFV